MNLSVIERMLMEGDFSLDAMRYLIQCRSECEWLDYKKELKLEVSQDICGFTKDIVAMKNMGGGYIVVGVQDKTWEPVGLSSQIPYDNKLLRDKIRSCSGLDLDVYIVHHEIQIDGSRRLFALICVRSGKKRQKRRMPTVIKNGYHAEKPFGLRSGEIYVRKGDETVRVSSEQELEYLLDALEASSDEDVLQTSGQPSPFAIKDGLYRLLEKGFNIFVGREQLRKEVFQSITRDPRIWIINVHGPGGVGKSAIVNWVTYEFYNKRIFEAIIHLSAKQTALTESGIKQCAGRTLHSLENLLDNILDTFSEPISSGLEEKKNLVRGYLSICTTLLVLDNMETVEDARILSFLQELPPDTKAKVLLTSREKTGGWELPIPITELDLSETTEFIRVKSEEMNAAFPIDDATIKKVLQISGGLPLAIQWIIGRYKIDKNIKEVFDAITSKDSPVLEFTFRHIWKRLSGDAKSILVVMSIFEQPPIMQQLSIATNWSFEKIEKSLQELIEVTLVTKIIQQVDGQTVYAMLPITNSFARNQAYTVGDFENECRKRLQKFNAQIELQEYEIRRFSNLFERYGLGTGNEKKAVILCNRGQSDMFSGNTVNADDMFKQARDLAPHSAYVFAMSASYELAKKQTGLALDYAKKACNLANKKTGELCYTVLASVLYQQHDKNGRVEALEKALDYAPNDVIIRHQYGVALSMAGQPRVAIQQFTKIIDEEKSKVPIRTTLLMALKTRIMNLRRIGENEEAKKDLLFAKEVLAQNPHLQSHAYHILELD